LRNVEHHEAFEERHRFCLVAVRPRALLLGFGREAVGVADRHSLLALADAAASGERLPEGLPTLVGVTFGDDLAPQDQDIDARIGAARHRVAGKAGAGNCRIPRLNPREAPRFKLGDNTRGHLVVKRGARLRAPCSRLGVRASRALSARAALPNLLSVVRWFGTFGGVIEGRDRPRQGVDVRRRACGVASADIRWSVA